MCLEWDSAKNESNHDKDGVPFDEAAELFRSSIDYLEIFAAAHSADEDRFLAVGPIGRGLIVGVYTERDDDVFRIVSARMATKSEERSYEEHAKPRRRR